MLFRRVFTSGLNAVRSFSVSRQLLGNLSPELKTKIQGLVEQGDVVLFMKGSPDQPMCGFSKTAKMILEFHQIPFKSVNVLADEDVREGIKEFSDWPTIPQLYVKGQFVGGSDILLQMHKDGEITQVFEDNGIKSKFSDQDKI
ncbi:unnamed protein product [Bursaphelenchus okinawaensis]|uniref:Glutaredoxin-related protein 5, mitochondrial n=1 Tax=Bursaphelenchus okinawaensis TaxID=465554 RepID=A0A811KJN5_9BILA|nr:unnamed protein product [Bursaphelenchus okinawaensis]CAG9103866.1 unnamed protein product [Bursaphelenchus okinawaensis]